MLMIFFFVMPATVSGFGNLLLPILASVPEMVFPKINNVGLAYSIYARPALCVPQTGLTVDSWNVLVGTGSGGTPDLGFGTLGTPLF